MTTFCYATVFARIPKFTASTVRVSKRARTRQVPMYLAVAEWNWWHIKGRLPLTVLSFADIGLSRTFVHILQPSGYYAAESCS